MSEHDKPLTEEELQEIGTRLEGIFAGLEETIEGEWGSGHTDDIDAIRYHVRRLVAALLAARAENAALKEINDMSAKRIRGLTALDPRTQNERDMGVEVGEIDGTLEAEVRRLRAENESLKVLRSADDVVADGWAALHRAEALHLDAEIMSASPFHVGQRVRVKATYYSLPGEILSIDGEWATVKVDGYEATSNVRLVDLGAED